jgi:DNA-directed RNA polymerase specialized sigma24 family protein
VAGPGLKPLQWGSDLMTITYGGVEPAKSETVFCPKLFKGGSYQITVRGKSKEKSFEVSCSPKLKAEHLRARALYEKATKKVIKAKLLEFYPNETENYDTLVHTNILEYLSVNTKTVLTPSVETYQAKSEVLGESVQSAGVPLKSSVDFSKVFDSTVELGIDLVNRGHEVRKILFAGYGGKIQSRNYDSDDVLQEVFKGLITRNSGKCPWDVRKSSFGHYVHMVCGCVLSNYHRRASRRDEVEQVGLRTYQDGQWQEANVSDISNESLSRESVEQRESAMNYERTDLASFIRRVSNAKSMEAATALDLLKHIHLGYTRKEMAKLLDLKESTIGRGMIYLRKCAKQWQLENRSA